MSDISPDKAFSSIYLVPNSFIDDWDKNVMHLWVCARNHDNRIPDDVLDFMRDLLLNSKKQTLELIK